MKKTLLIVAISCFSILVIGQSGDADYKSGNSFALQMDAFDFAAKGFSFWVNYTFHYNRIFIDAGKNELPDLLNPQGDDFKEKRKFFFQTGYYRFLRKPNGLFVGVEGIYQQMEISSKNTTEVKDNDVVRIAPVIGYEWAPFKRSLPRFTLTPWMSERFPLYSTSVDFPQAEKSYKTANFNFVMGLNVGYRL